MTEGFEWSVGYDAVERCAHAESWSGEHISVKIYNDDPVVALMRAYDYTAKPFKTATFAKAFNDYMRSTP